MHEADSTIVNLSTRVITEKQLSYVNRVNRSMLPIEHIPIEYNTFQISRPQVTRIESLSLEI